MTKNIKEKYWYWPCQRAVASLFNSWDASRVLIADGRSSGCPVPSCLHTPPATRLKGRRRPSPYWLFQRACCRGFLTTTPPLVGHLSGHSLTENIYMEKPGMNHISAWVKKEGRKGRIRFYCLHVTMERDPDTIETHLQNMACYLTEQSTFPARIRPQMHRKHTSLHGGKEPSVLR